MKRLCNRPAEEIVRSNRILIYMFAAFILLYAGYNIFQAIHGELNISASSSVCFCSMTVIMCGLIINTKKLEKEIADKKTEESEEN